MTEFKSTVSDRTINAHVTPSRTEVTVYISADTNRTPGPYTAGRDIVISGLSARLLSIELSNAADKAEQAKKKEEAEKKAAEAAAAKPKTELQILREALQKISTDTYCFPRQAAKDALRAADEKTMITFEPTPYAHAYLPIPNRYLVGFVN